MTDKRILIDDLAKEYPRKDKYLLELVYAKERRDKKAFLQLKRTKNEHPYNIKLKAFREAEKAFLQDLRTAAATYRQGLTDMDRKERKLAVDIFKSVRIEQFYQEYVELHYDAELHYRQALVRIARQTRILDRYSNLKLALKEAEAVKLAVKDSDDRADRELAKRELAELKQQIQKEQALSKAKLKDRTISPQALKISKREDQKHYQAVRRSRIYSTPKLKAKDHIASIKHDMTVGMRDDYKVLNAELSSVRRGVPEETRQVFVWKSYLSIILPGLGQLLLGQWQKSILFFLGSFFIYGMALPYALGYGNYQGQGIAGLISLAEGGLRVDRSLIYMIEGVLALLICLFSVLIMIASFLDARKAEKNKLKGIRTTVWTETLANVERSGFPFLVNIPTFVIVILIIGIPIITTLLLSFTNMDPQHQGKFQWAGLQNYRIIAFGEGLTGSIFWRILGWTIVWTLCASTLQIFIGMCLALMTNNPRVKGKRFFRTVFILPWAVPAFITIIFFSLMLASNGILDQLFSNLFLNGAPLNVKNNTMLTRLALILIQGWCGSSYIFLLTTGTLQAIPGDLYEAADIDGATSWQRLRRVTLPLILFQTAPLLVGQYTFNFNNYTIIDIFNGGGPFVASKYGNLAGSSDLLISYIFKLTVENQYQALGAAISIIISLALIVVAFMGYRQTAAFKEM